MKTPVVFLEKWPKAKNWLDLFGHAKVVVIYDQHLKGNIKKAFGRHCDFIPVSAGEKLKSFTALSNLAENVLKLVSGHSASEIILVAVGGGSVGDAVGFLASVLKRGVRLVHVPSTYLAAVDSAHGCKTAINVGGFKNQIGSYMPADCVVIIRALLAGQPELNLRSAYGELLKMAVIDGGQLFLVLNEARVFDADLFWRLLPLAVEAKLKIVARDPFENKGLRHLLNLGHTMGHAIEANENIAHGLAVQMGLEFSLALSQNLKFLSVKDFKDLSNLVSKNCDLTKSKISKKKLWQLLARDKKSTKARNIKFILVKKPGQAFVKELPVSQIVDAAEKLGWTR